MRYNVIISSLVFAALCSCDKPNQAENQNNPPMKIEKSSPKPSEINKNNKNQENNDDQQSGKLTLNIAKSALVGTWVLHGHDCQSGDGLMFARNGKYASETEEGDWVVEDLNLKVKAISNDGETGIHPVGWVVKVIDIDEKSAILQRDDGSNMQWTRCKGVPNL